MSQVNTYCQIQGTIRPHPPIYAISLVLGLSVCPVVYKGTDINHNHVGTVKEKDSSVPA